MTFIVYYLLYAAFVIGVLTAFRLDYKKKIGKKTRMCTYKIGTTRNRLIHGPVLARIFSGFFLFFFFFSFVYESGSSEWKRLGCEMVCVFYLPLFYNLD